MSVLLIRSGITPVLSAILRSMPQVQEQDIRTQLHVFNGIPLPSKVHVGIGRGCPVL